MFHRNQSPEPLSIRKAKTLNERSLLLVWLNFAIFLSLFVFLLTGIALAQDKTSRVLSIGGAVTEIVYALGEQDRLVARDSTSTFPAQANELPDVGYMRALSPEGVLSVEPDLIIAIEDAGPPATMEVLNASSAKLVSVPSVDTEEGIIEKITIVGDALGVPDKAASLVDQFRKDMDNAEAKVSELGSVERKKVLFVLSAQGGRILAAGSETAADAIINMAGAVNVVQEFEGYKHVSDEAIASAAPDVVLMMDRGGNHSISDEVLLSMPAMQATPAAQTSSVIRMSGLLLLGFGPRTAQAVGQLNDKLYGP